MRNQDSAPFTYKLSERAYQQLLWTIMEKDFERGSKLPSEFDLSKQFRVSRPVLRQALSRLREEGIVVSRQGSGTFVERRPDTALVDFAPHETIIEMKRTFEFRAVLECAASRVAARRRSQEDIVRLRSALDDLDSATRQGNSILNADAAFHEAICLASDNKNFLAALVKTEADVRTTMMATGTIAPMLPKDEAMLVKKEHSAVLDAIIAKDEDAADRAMRSHIESTLSRVFAF